MKTSYGIILLICGVISPAFNYVFHYPLEKNIHWYPANHSSLRCPVRSARILDTPTGGITLQLPGNPSNHDIPGYSCHKTEWVSECVETWYWSTDVKEYIRSVPVTFEECQRALQDKSIGNEVSPFFTAPTCQWSNTVRKVNTFVIVHSKDAKLDPYNLDRVDPIFPGGRCKSKEKYCPTIQAGVIWLQKVSQRITIEWQTIKAKYKRIGNNMEDWKLWGGGMPTSTFRGACKMDFAAKTGIRASNGFWFHVPNISDSAFKDAFNAMTQCPQNTEVKFPSAHEEVAEHEMEIQDLILTLRCRDIIDKFAETGQISFMDLSLFDPDNEGPAHVYRIRNGKLETGIVNYGECRVGNSGDKDPANSICIKIADDGIRAAIFYDDWVSTGEKGIQSAFNGLYRENGVIRHAGYNLFANKLTEKDIEKQDLQQVHHPIDLVIEKFMPGLNLTFDTTGQRGEVYDLFPDIKGFWRSVLEYSVIGFFVLITIIFIWIVVKCCGCFRMKRHNQIDDYYD
ncbi:glycoprotein [Sripur virus]|uniref:Glycoprotein n=1 Tax=Sripur virus TaxID=1620897 RepID=A0A0D3R288_9RHAB|nr:glycoprotein [Sripur virus]AJR28582.1 glycoprotein [Sripur virus]